MNWTLFWIIVFSLLALAVLYVLSTRCRKSGPEMRKLCPYYYAHRGLHNAFRPENSMSAFRAARDAGYGIELDVHLTKDGTLAVIHDHDLLRVTGKEGNVEALTQEDLWQYRLDGTSEHIPTLGEVLDMVDGQIPLIIELKAKGNHAALTEAVCNRLENYKGLYCIESFDPRCIRWLRKNRPQVIRGQLSRNFFRDKKSTLPWILKLCMTCQLLNFWTRPDFVAYLFADRKRLGNRLVKKIWGAARVAWTIRTPENCKTARREGWIPIFENFEP